MSTASLSFPYPASLPFIDVALGVACATVTVCGATGTVGLDIAGEPAVRIQACSTDEETAAALVAELEQAGSPFTDYVRGSASGATVTLDATAAGPLGNLVSLQPVGVGLSASGPYLSGGTSRRITL